MMLFKTELIHLEDKEKIQTWVLDECLLQIMLYETHKQESDSIVDILKKGYQLFESFKP
jgi:molecular chaperone GrpE (heat shock protein)